MAQIVLIIQGLFTDNQLVVDRAISDLSTVISALSGHVDQLLAYVGILQRNRPLSGTILLADYIKRTGVDTITKTINVRANAVLTITSSTYGDYTGPCIGNVERAITIKIDGEVCAADRDFMTSICSGTPFLVSATCIVPLEKGEHALSVEVARAANEGTTVWVNMQYQVLRK